MAGITTILQPGHPDPAIRNTLETSKRLQELLVHCSQCQSISSKLIKTIYPTKSFLFGGGSQPLEAVNIYQHDGSHGVPKHWHYIGFGLTDIFCHDEMCRTGQKLLKQNDPLDSNRNLFPSSLRSRGFGLELTFRLKLRSNELIPPTWPVDMMQKLAYYVVKTKNIFREYDSTVWQEELGHESGSFLKHIIMTLDTELGRAQFDNGQQVAFIQLVGVCKEELAAARLWTSKGILSMLQQYPDTGSKLLVTDMNRCKSIFETRPKIENLIGTESNFALIYSDHQVSFERPDWFDSDDDSIESVSEIDSEEDSSSQERRELMSKVGQDVGVYLQIDLELCKMLPDIMNGRLLQGKQFTIVGLKENLRTTFVPGLNRATNHQSSARMGDGVQIYIPDELAARLSTRVEENLDECESDDDEPDDVLPDFNWSWPEFGFHLTIKR